ncbi:hypothetical protein KP509_26G007900 [Ceratopteris richardii]|uniref:Pentatricopeptide repeat-containing protein n=1 Tax=Ceratopteris richardii TaxID=49495 RepID=A0A8T2RKF8_CERRI|nr:hypothetical protein KP509_26G007900 [Ceratopteris richardii]
MLEGYSEWGSSEQAFELFCQMHHQNIKPDRATLVIILKACSTTANVMQGRALHSYLIRTGCELDDVIASSLIHMYSNYGSIEDAAKVFDGSKKDDIVTWNTMIAGYVLHRRGQDAVYLYEQICARGLELDKVTCISMLKACSSIVALKLGKVVHARTCQLCCELDVEVGNALIDMYTRCGIWRIFFLWRAHLISSTKEGSSYLIHEGRKRVLLVEGSFFTLATERLQFCGGGILRGYAGRQEIRRRIGGRSRITATREKKKVVPSTKRGGRISFSLPRFL